RRGGRARRVRGEPEGGHGGPEQGLAGGRRGPPAGHARRARAARGAPSRRPLPRLPAGRSGGARRGDRAPARRSRLRGEPRARRAGAPARALRPRAPGGVPRRNPRRAFRRACGRPARDAGRRRLGGQPVRTAAVVVTWEGGATTDRCVASVLAQDRPADEVIVVDNASREPERARLGAAYGGRPGVRLLLLDENRQFAGGLNAGAEAALAAGAERLLCLNNDTVLAPDALGLLAAALDAR